MIHGSLTNFIPLQNDMNLTQANHPVRFDLLARSWARRLRSSAFIFGVAGALFVAAPATAAADNNPPDEMTYQGFLADASGVGLAPSNPLNYDAIFRIYDAANGGTLLWAESQIITVDKGTFSVILGQGAQNASEPRPALSSVFASGSASDRFLAINIKVGASALDILPRLRLLPGGYAFLARNANNLVDPRGTNVITTATPGMVGINKTPATALDVNGTVTATAFAGDGSGLINLDATKMSGTVDNARLAANVALLSRNPQAFAGVNTFAGNVGINTTAPAGKLHVNGGVAVTGTSSPFAVGTAGLFMEYGGTALLYGYDYGSNGGPKDLALQSPGGKVGIGTTTPQQALHVNGSTLTTGTAYLLDSNNYIVARFGQGVAIGSYGAADGFFLQQSSGNVGIGNTSPVQKLDVNGSIYARSNMYTDGFIYNKWNNAYYALVGGNGGNGSAATWNTSDERLKQDVTTIGDALGILEKLRGVSYHWNEKGLEHLTRDIEKMWRSASGTEEDNRKLWAEKKQEALKRLNAEQTGFIAQEVERVFPSWVRIDDKGYRQINVDQLSGVIVQAVNDLNKKHEAQESELKELRAEVTRLRGEKKALAELVSERAAQDEARFARIEKALSERTAARDWSQAAK